MDGTLDVIMQSAETRCLGEEEHVLLLWIPAHCNEPHSRNEHGKGDGEETRDGSRWLGSESNHLFSAESRSATMPCSHCWSD